MKVIKEYIEWYALLSLIYCYDENLSPLKDSKVEEPDWQSEALDIGLEVTEALESDDGRKRSVINNYFGKGLDGNIIKNHVEKEYPEYSHFVNVVGNTACFSLYCDMIPKIEQVVAAIVSKTAKLNEHYKKYKNNWLYVFAPDLFADFDIPYVFNAYRERTSQYHIQFDKIFINAHDCIFILTLEGLNDQILISDSNLKRLKKDAMEYAEFK